MPRARPGSAAPMPTSTAATCTPCWRRAWRRGRSPSIIAWSRSTRRATPSASCSRTAWRRMPISSSAPTASNSKVREYLLGSEPPRYVGMAAHRAIFPTDGAARLRNSGLHQVVGPRPAYPRLFHDQPARRGLRHRRRAARRRWRAMPRRCRARARSCCACFDGFHADLLRVIEVTTDVTRLADLRSRAQRPLERRPHRAARRCLPSDASVHGGGRRHGDRGCRHPQPLPRAVRRTCRGLIAGTRPRASNGSAKPSASRSRTAGCAGRPTPTGSIATIPARRRSTAAG